MKDALPEKIRRGVIEVEEALPFPPEAQLATAPMVVVRTEVTEKNAFGIYSKQKKYVRNEPNREGDISLDENAPIPPAVLNHRSPSKHDRLPPELMALDGWTSEDYCWLRSPACLAFERTR